MGQVGPLAGRVIGVYASGGAPWHHLALAALAGAEVRPVRAEDIAAGRLSALDVLIVPGGGATAMAGLLAPLGGAGAERIRLWVERGGTYVSSCAGSVLPLALSDMAEAALPTARCLRMVEVPMANLGDATLGGLASPGVGRISVRLAGDHPLTTGLGTQIELVHYNGPLFDMARAPAAVRAFAWPVAPTAEFTAAEAFLTDDTRPAQAVATVAEPPGPAFQEPPATTLARCIAAGAATALEAPFGRGRAVLFGSHPEFGLGPLLLGWGAGARLLTAALAASDPYHEPRSTAGSTPGGDQPHDADPAWAVRSEFPGRPVAALAQEAESALRAIAVRFAALAGRDLGDWLRPGMAASFHGRDAATAWREDTAAAGAAAAAVAQDLAGLRGVMDAGDLPWLDDVPRPDQDFGAMGLVQLLGRITAMLAAAEEAASRPAQRPAHAYDLFDSHPFHLAVGSYLSAAGLTAAAVLTVAVIAARHHAAIPASASLLWAAT